jgi:RNA polymerase sigma-70 factor, ECF subfamily
VRIEAKDNSDSTTSVDGAEATVKAAEVFLAEATLLRKVVAGLGLFGNDADDVLQAVSVKCLNHTPTFGNRSQCRRWLIRVTTNACVTEHRRTGRFRRHKEGIGKHRRRSDPTGPVDNAISTERTEAIRQALHEMDDTLLRPLALRYFCNLSSAEIGETLDMPAATVRSLLYKGRLALAKALMKRGIQR